MTSNFLLVRYAPGSAGKMFIGLLGMHPEIANWNTDSITQIKWFKRHFQKDLSKWLYNEPQNPWQMQKYFSAVYPRGDDLQELPINLPDQWIPVVWQKNYTADFIKNFFSINICIDKQSVKWYHRTRWKKQFSCNKVNNEFEIIQHQHRPSYQVKNFNNQYKITVKSVYTFIKKEIVNYELKKNFLEDSIINLSPGYNLKLSDLLEWETCKKNLYTLQEQLQLQSYNWNNAKECWHWWKNLHEY